MRPEKSERLKKWEIALICAAAAALLSGAPGVSPDSCAWWGAIYPELSPDGGALPAAALGADGVELRFRLLEWLGDCLRALRLI